MVPSQEIPLAEDLTPRARRILEIASDLFYRHGIHRVGVDAIAAESGVTKRTLYNNFRSKDQLVAAYLRNRHVAWWAGLERALEAARSPRALVLFEVYLDDARRGERGCAFLNAAGELSFDHPAYAVIAEHKRAVAGRLAELVAEDVPSVNAGAVADHLFLLLEGAMAHRAVSGPELLAQARGLAAEVLRAAQEPRSGGR